VSSLKKGGSVEFEEWAARVLREGIGVGAVFLLYRGRGVAPQRAHDLAVEAVQEALVRAASIGDVPARFQHSFVYFCNWVRMVASNYARSICRREQRARQLAETEAEDIEAPSAEPPERVQLLRDFLQQATQEERDLLLLSYEEGLTLDDLAQRFLPPDDRSESARRLAIWRRRRDTRRRLRQWLLERGLAPSEVADLTDDCT
jgi:RNA polymerase sigma factor (sigma-70 family)